MRVLLTNHHLEQMGGTETWVLTMARYLSTFCDVGVFTHHKGFVSDLLKDFIDDDPKDYDLALINHNTCIDVDAKFKIFTSHGTEPSLEKPMQGCDIYVGVNEAVADRHRLEYVIKNPIDTKRFKPTHPLNDEPKKVLDISTGHFPGEAIKPSRTNDNMPELINQADLVVSMGRGALEAMSCGRPVITWDSKINWGARGDGYLYPPIYGYTAGPYFKRKINWKEELSKYNPKDGKKNREYILKHHAVQLIAQEYLDLWKTATKNDI